MEDAIRRSVERQFPELTGGYHLPRFARVIGVADAPASAGICDDFRPRYAVDLQLLDENDEPDPALPALAFVPPGATAARPLRHVLSQSFAFGGSNAVLVFGEG